ncbi:hypothetical protein [Acidovorax sp. sic0104]|uniref:hypothetical protein n=1 Tax=Acidovorax sp. sic0104 TaxID=2854784 RepID=UPI001C44B342|nr:hypothetical protein [Acidovorax sp. sic0104]MBV7542229.1 hypothetical protein [Acidovorax sp. sic0104]
MNAHAAGAGMREAKVYSLKLSSAQNMACQRMEAVSGLPPVCLEDLEAGTLTPTEFWRMQLVTIHDISVAVQNIDFPTEERA